MVLSSVIGAFALFAASAIAAPSSASQLDRRQDCTFKPATSPECWDGVYDLKTDYYTQGPKTKDVRTYDFKITNVTTLAPDGVPRTVLAINGQIPGPTIWANWGDTIVVNVENALDYAGTTLHFHGIRQNHTIGQDGVPSITQCPIPGDGGKMTYKFVATQYGTSWYHSHYGVQAWDGVFGAIHIEGPASEKYDTDLGPVMLSDWTHATSDSLMEAAALNFGGVPMNNGLVNGTNTYKNADGTTVGKRFELVFEKDKAYRIRFINTAMDTMYKLTFDDHEMQVISADFVSIKPFTTKVLPIAIGQRYDVIVKASAGGGNHWFRAIPMRSCGTGHDEPFDVRAIVRYDANNKDTPEEKEAPVIDDDCLDVPTASLKPSLEIDLKDVPPKVEPDHKLAFEMNYDSTTQLVDWRVNQPNEPYYTPWDYPTLEQILEGNTTYDKRQQLIHVDGKKEWIYALVTTGGTTHPIHLHGHDFFILGQSDQEFNPDTFVPQTVNPPRRDVAMVVGLGYIFIAFQTDNPGAWLLHCHIGWHAEQGFALTFMEDIDQVKNIVDEGALLKQCGDWKSFAAAKGIKQHGSGV
ncbi:laccase 3 [Immersiella caudata]|uniref:Laccase 3 n=1 Tax=Immersiella caudata TaxID=314043 RepID=A0AA40C2L2_9PEZI|nr:laccase 3 [Immersiella caudata]